MSITHIRLRVTLASLESLSGMGCHADTYVVPCEGFQLVHAQQKGPDHHNRARVQQCCLGLGHLPAALPYDRQRGTGGIVCGAIIGTSPVVGSASCLEQKLRLKGESKSLKMEKDLATCGQEWL